jgi:hypothetical protein
MYRTIQMWASGVWNGGQWNSSACQYVASRRTPVNTRLPHTIQRSRSQLRSNAALRKKNVRNT